MQHSGAQAEALNVQDVLAGGNLVYSAPTSAGKSAVAEVLMLRRLILKKRPALLVLPFVSLCAEKVAHLEHLLAPLNKCGPPDTLPAASACVWQRHRAVQEGLRTHVHASCPFCAHTGIAMTLP